jgi:hypothetical protein
MRTLLVLLGLAVITPIAAQQQAQPPTALPNKPDSFRFVVIGNSGTGDQAQAQLAQQLVRLRERFKYDYVVMLGGNIQGGERPQDYMKKFETPFKPLLDAGVKFHAALGRDDSRDQRFYKHFNMGGEHYYVFSPVPEVQLFALESTYPSPEQIQWLEQELGTSKSRWKIAFFEALVDPFHPPLLKHHVNLAVTGEERSGNQSQPGSGLKHLAAGPNRFLAIEIVGDELFYNAISPAGETVATGKILVSRKP